MLHGHGNDIYQYRKVIKADFSSNIAYGGTHHAVVEHIKQSVQLVRDYPEPDASSLCEAIAKREGVGVENILVTNGSTEAFYLLAQLFKNGKSLIFSPSFAEYEDAATCHGHKINYQPSDTFPGELTERYDCIWLGNPNNPDGVVTDVDVILNFCRTNPDVFLFLDEAYHALCKGYVSPLSLGDIPNNLVVVRSLTKLFALPGLRLGYIVAGEDFCNALRNIKMPWSVNALAIEAGIFIMSRYEYFTPDVDALLNESARFQQQMAKIERISVKPSNCNYFLAEEQRGTAGELKKHLIEEHGFLIRDASNFRGLAPSHFRVAALSPELNNQLVNAIKSWIQKTS
ncbi:aminotransferase class I/II-fold pyridoxal phosphate-dependent enzyme [Natronoflexus pectinivorans]|uniref:Aminotransferase n=1 Tax=Natronoflexus pectinivorans TaxID=682526 RepID=A0A4R2GID6_9BACT|nr:aminotransferase class I/II-fold pyridoxal phosphate-dependent enzyme [Natronoflexus pectinivorans]TCO08053.1 threonine-phosphate decarboxylase [Natronoflexus pectinivorans]